MNDNAPAFERRSYRCALSEDAKRGQFVTMVTATDDDITDQSRLVYSITAGNDQQMFHIDPTNGTSAFLPVFSQFFIIIQIYNRFYRVIPSFTEFYRVLPGFTDFTEFYRVKPMCN